MSRVQDILNKVQNAGGTTTPGTNAASRQPTAGGRVADILSKYAGTTQKQPAAEQKTEPVLAPSAVPGGAPTVTEKPKAPSVPARTSGNVLDELNAVKAEADTAARDLDKHISGGFGYNFTYKTPEEAKAAQDKANERKIALQSEYDSLLATEKAAAAAKIASEITDADVETGKAIQANYDRAAQELDRYMSGNTAGYEFTYKSPEEAKAALDNIRKYYGDLVASPSTEKRNSYMTEDEWRQYYGRLGAFTDNSARDYYLGLIPELNARQGADAYEAIKDKGVVAKTAKNLEAGLGNFAIGIGQNFTDRPLAQKPSAYTAGKIQENADTKFGQYYYQAMQSVGNMLPQMAASVLFGPGGGTVGSVLTGVSSAGNAYGEALASGYSEDRARLYGALVGGSEAMLSELLGGAGKATGLGEEALLNKVAMWDKALARLAGRAAVKIGAEIAEEEAQLFLEPLFRSFIFGEKYDGPNGQEMLDTAIVTALSTAFMEPRGILADQKAEKPAPTTPTDTTPTAEQTAQPADTTAPEAAAERLQAQEATVMPTQENAPQATQEAAPDVMTQEAQRLFGKNETAASKETTVNMGMVSADTSRFDRNILENANKAREYLIVFARKFFPPSVVNSETGRTISIPRKGLDKFLSGRLYFEKYASGFHIPELIENAKKVGIANNYHEETAGSIPTYEYFDSPIMIEGIRYNAHIRVKNTNMGDKYYGHTISEVDEIKIEPSTRTSASENRMVQPVEIDGSKPIIPDGGRNGNSENLGNTVGAAEMGFSPFSHAELEYGTMDGGENAVRPDDMPVSTDGVNRVSRTAVTVKGAKVTPDEFVPLLERRVMDANKNNGLRYIPITNDATTQAAMDDISESGWDDALRDWTSDVRGGKVSAELTAKGAILYNHAVNSGNKKLALDILSDYAANVRSAAQGLQAARILKTLTPDDSLYMIQKSIDRMVKDMNLPEGIKISEDLKEAYRNAEDQETRNEVLGFMQQEVARQLSATTADKWRAWRMVSMLGTFKGPLRNITSNVLTGTMYRAKNALRAGIEKLFRGKFGRTSSAFISKELMDAGRRDFAANKDTIVDGSRHGEAFSTDSFLRGAQEQMQIFDFTPLEGARRLTNYALNNERFGDEAFMRNAYARYLGGWLKANGITAENWNSDQWQEQNGETAAAARAFAKQQAQEATLRDHNELSDIAAKAGRGANKGRAAKILSVIGEALMPFRRTPTDAIVRMEQYSPLGIANAVANAVMARNGQTNSRGETVTSQDVLESICKALTGSGVMLLGGLLARAGTLRGSEDEDEKQAQFDELTGQQESAIYLPDGTNFTIDWAAPATAPLLIGAELEKIRQEGGWSWNEFFDTLLSISDPLLETSMLSGLNKAIEDVKYSDHPIPDLAIALTMDFFGQGASTLAGQVSRSFREDSTMTYVDKESHLPSVVQKGLGEVSRKLPGPGYNQVPYIDAWGRTENIGETLAGRFVNNVFNPAFVDKAEKDATETELQRLYDSEIDKDGLSILPTRAAKYFNMDGETVNLTAEQYVEYATAKGQLSKQYIEEAMATPEYQRMDDKGKAEYVSKMYNLANYHAKQKLFPDYTSKNYKSYDTWAARGLTPAKSYLLIADWQ